MKNKNIYFADYSTFESRYFTTNGLGEQVTVSVGRRGQARNENSHTAFDDCCGGLRLLTEEEVLDIVATLNAEQGYKQGDVEADGTPILTYAQ